MIVSVLLDGNPFLDRILVKINYYNDTKLMILFNIAKYLIKHDLTEERDSKKEEHLNFISKS